MLRSGRPVSAISATLAGMFAAVSAAGLVIAAPARSVVASTCPYPLAIDGWSPDSGHVAFEGALDPRHTGYYDDGGIVGIADTHGSVVRIVSATPFAHRFDQDGGIVWAPDGRSVVYVHLTVVGSYPGGEPKYASTLIRVALKTDARVIVRGGRQGRVLRADFALERSNVVTI